MQTLGELTDRLIVTQLKLIHKLPEEKQDIQSLNQQAEMLRNEIDMFLSDAASGSLDPKFLKVPQCKVYKKEGNETDIEISGQMSSLIQGLMEANFKMWKNQEKLYDFENVPVDQKDQVVKKCCILNLERNKFMDAIDNLLYNTCQ